MSCCVLNSPSNGLLVGHFLGLAFFSQHETAGQTHAATFRNQKDAEDFLIEFGAHLPGDIEVVEVADGHWRTLAEAGFETGDMALNELMHMPAQGSA